MGATKPIVCGVCRSATRHPPATLDRVSEIVDSSQQNACLIVTNDNEGKTDEILSCWNLSSTYAKNH